VQNKAWLVHRIQITSKAKYLNADPVEINYLPNHASI